MDVNEFILFYTPSVHTPWGCITELNRIEAVWMASFRGLDMHHTLYRYHIAYGVEPAMHMCDKTAIFLKSQSVMFI